MVELDPKYVDTIILRWQEFSGGTATLDGDGRTYRATSPRSARLSRRDQTRSLNRLL